MYGEENGHEYLSRNRKIWKRDKDLYTHNKELKPICKPTSRDDKLPIDIPSEDNLTNVTTKKVLPPLEVVTEEEKQISSDNPQEDLILWY